MSLAAPAWLAVLAVIPAAAVLSALARRRAGRYSVRFPAVATVQLATAASASWRRRLPALLALVAIAVLAVALARPQVRHAVAVGSSSVMLVSDESGSMAATDVQPSRLAAAERAADDFIDHLPSNIKVGAIAFSSAPNDVQAPTTDHAAARAVIDDQQANGATATGPALQLALQLLHAADPRHPPAAIVLLSDGAANAGVSPLSVARQAYRDHVPISTIALGTPGGELLQPLGPPVAVPPDPQLMAQIAQISGGRSFSAQTASEVSSIYDRLGREVASVERPQSVASELAALAGALLMAAVLLAIRFSPRLP